MGTIRIKGYAEKEVFANVVDITITFKAKDVSISNALKKVKEESEFFLKELSKIGFNLNNFKLEKDKSSDEGYGDNQVKVAKRTISLKTKTDMVIVNAIISVITENKLDVEINTDYSYFNEQGIQRVLLQEAILDSKEKAQAIASINNQTVKYAELVTDNKDEYYKEEYINKKGGYVTDIYLDEELLSDQLSTKVIKLQETIYVTWVIE